MVTARLAWLKHAKARTADTQMFSYVTDDIVQQSPNYLVLPKPTTTKEQCLGSVSKAYNRVGNIVFVIARHKPLKHVLGGYGV